MNIYTYVHKSGNARISLQNLAIVLILLSGIFITGTVKGQQGVAPVTTPSGGFAVDGNLLARVPVNTIFTSSNGDFLPNDGAPGTGGNVFTLAGLPLDTTMAFHLVDGYDATEAGTFTGGSKFNGNPNSWKWKSGKPPQKDDIHHSLFFFTYDASGNLWFIGSGDRKSANGNSYMDFELLQNPLTRNADGTFTSQGPDGGRTIGDLAITVWYTNGGPYAQLFIHQWASTGTGTFNYVAVTPAAGTTYLATNKDSAVVVPYGAFGAGTYPKHSFTEVACNLNDLISGTNNCLDISTVIVKTKASQSLNAELKDFIDPIQVDISSGPVISVNNDTVCYGDTATLTVTVLTGAGPFTYLWSNGATTPSISVSPDTTTQYWVVVTSANGCPSDTAWATVVVLPLPVVEITGPDTICFGDTATLAANVISGTGPYTYLWNTGDTTQTITVAPDSTTLYSVVVTGGNGCPSDPAEFTLTVMPELTAMIEGPDSICTGDTIVLMATVLTGTGPFTYAWNTGATTQSITAAPDTTTLYSVVVTGLNGCTSEPAELTVNVFNIPVCSITGPDTICPAGSAQYSAPADTLNTYAWSVAGAGTIVGSATGQTVEVEGTGDCDSTFTLTLVVEGPGGCTSTCTKTVVLADTINPVISDVPADLTVLCASDVPAAGSDTVTVTDNCEGEVTLVITDSITDQTCTNQFTVLRTWTATDLCGNTATALQTITVFDSLAPVMEGVPADTGVCCPDSIPDPADVTAFDSCDGEMEVELTEIISDSTGPNYFVLTRIWVAEDSCGNMVADTQVITVNDTLYPPIYPQGIGVDGSGIVRFTISPNPFITNATIEFVLSRDAAATVELYNTMGARLRNLYNGNVKAGDAVRLQLAPDPAMGPGVYFVVIKTEKGIRTGRIVLTR